jgi:hypothetical protein
MIDLQSSASPVQIGTESMTACPAVAQILVAASPNTCSCLRAFAPLREISALQTTPSGRLRQPLPAYASVFGPPPGGVYASVKDILWQTYAALGNPGQEFGKKINYSPINIQDPSPKTHVLLGKSVSICVHPWLKTPPNNAETKRI